MCIILPMKLITDISTNVYHTFQHLIPSHSEYLVRNQVRAVNQQDLVVQAVKCAPFPTPMAWRRCKYIDLGKALKKTIESVIIIIPRWTSPPSFLRSAIPFFALVFDELGNQVSLQTNFGNV